MSRSCGGPGAIITLCVMVAVFSAITNACGDPVVILTSKAIVAVCVATTNAWGDPVVILTGCDRVAVFVDIASACGALVLIVTSEPPLAGLKAAVIAYQVELAHVSQAVGFSASASGFSNLAAAIVTSLVSFRLVLSWSA